MRIVGGRNKRKFIVPPPNFRARPTTDFAKENLFNVINNYFDIEDLEVLDLFSGTGSISYEFGSRGAKRIVSVEMNPVHHKFIQSTAAELKFDQMSVIRSNALVYIKSIKDSFDFIFADPPYDMDGVDDIPDMIFKYSLLREDGWFVLEHSADKDFSKHPRFIKHRKYGSVNFSIFTNESQAQSEDQPDVE